MGNIVSQTVKPADGSSSLTTKFSFDAQGRRTSETDNAGGSDTTANRTTSIVYAPFDGTYNTSTTTYPDGSTSIESDYLDGTVASIGGTAEVATSYSHGVASAATPDGDGNTISAGSTYVTSSTDAGANTTTDYTNVLGEQYLSVESAPSGEAQATPGQASTVDSRTTFDGNDRPTETINFDGSKDESVYDPYSGQLGAAWTSMDGSSTFDSADSKTLYDSWYGGASSTLLSASGNQVDQVSYTNGGLTTTDNLNGLITTTSLVMDGGGKYHITTSNPDGIRQKDSYTAGLLTDSQQLTTGTTPTAISDTSYYYNPNRTLEYSIDYTGRTNYTEFQDGTEKSVQLPGQQWQTATSIDKGTEDPTNITNPDNTTTKQTENEMGQTATQSGAGVIASKLGYNADGQMTTLTTYPGGDPTNTDDPGAATTNWGYDPATGLMTGKSYADGNGVDMKYNPAGQLKTLTEPGMTDAFGYNPAGQQTSSTAIDSQTGMVLSQVLAEDDQGRAMLTMSLDNGQFASDTNTYTALGQPLNESFGAAGNTTVAHGYYPVTPAPHDPTASIQSPDALASMTIQNLPSGQANAQTTYGYDSSSKRLQTITVNGVTFTIGYVQGSSSQIGSITTTVAGQTGNALTTTLSPYYGSNGNPSKLGGISVTAGASTLYNATLVYNTSGQIATDNVTRTNPDSSQSGDNYTYGYGTGPGDNTNDANSLTQVKDNGNVTESYSYDGVGNFLDSSLGDADALNQYAALSYNLCGDVTNDTTYAYTYDANDRMISVAPDNPASGDKLTFGYDSQGRRIWKNVYTWDHYNSVWDLAYSRSYVYDGTQLVGELDGNGKLLTGYTWSPGGGLLAVTDYTQASPRTYQAILDASGNTALLVDLTNGTVAASYTYDSYGNLLSATGPAQAICSILGKGLYYDLEARSIGHALNRDIRSNTWYERDPAGEIAGGENLYQPYGDDPVDLSDTSGLKPSDYWSAFGIAKLTTAGEGWLIAKAKSAADASGHTTIGKILGVGVGVNNAVFNMENSADFTSPVQIWNRGVDSYHQFQNFNGLRKQPGVGIPGAVIITGVSSTPVLSSIKNGYEIYYSIDVSNAGNFGNTLTLEEKGERGAYIAVDAIGAFSLAHVALADGSPNVSVRPPDVAWDINVQRRWAAPRYYQRSRGMVINPFARSAGVTPAVEEALANGDLNLVSPNNAGLAGAGGRLGSPVTRAQVRMIAAELRARGWTVIRGGGGPEEFMRGPSGGTLGSAYPDITAIKGARILRINTYTTLSDGITPTVDEAARAANLRSLLEPGEHLLMVPKTK